MKILAIETSCDDTGIAILEYGKTGQPNISADFVSSQTEVHAPWGGVVPMLAKREHQRNLTPLFIKALKESGLPKAENSKPKTSAKGESASGGKNYKLKTLDSILEREPELLKKLLPLLKKYRKPDIDYIAVTVGPGLEPALWAGINFARAISYFWDIPLLPINHIEGHLTAAFHSVVASEAPASPDERASIAESRRASRGRKQFRDIAAVHGIAASPAAPRNDDLPAICLTVSGGHTQLILVKKIGRYEIIGETRDDAAGEAFDKVAKMLNLGYPGGPAISRLAEKWKSQTKNYKLKTKNFPLPRPMLNSGDFDFSFSGLKTAVLYALQKMTAAQIKKQTSAIAAEFEQAVIDVLTAKTLSAAKKYRAKTIALAGGVAANQALRQELAKQAKDSNLNFLVPSSHFCTDNAAMIGLAAFYRLKQSRAKKAAWRALKAQANLRIS